ncbi:hypothetical protein NQL31_006249 [Lotmaria passim]
MVSPPPSPDVSLVSLPGVGGVLHASQSHPATPDELYVWLADKLQLDFTQTLLPQCNVSRHAFEKATR